MWFKGLAKYSAPTENLIPKMIGRLCVVTLMTGIVFALWFADPDPDDYTLNVIIWLVPMSLGFFIAFSVSDLVMKKLKLYGKTDATRDGTLTEEAKVILYGLSSS